MNNRNLFRVKCLMLASLALLPLAGFAQKTAPSSYLGVVEIKVDTSDASLRKRIYDYVEKKIINLDNVVGAIPGKSKGDYLIIVMIEQVTSGRDPQYVMSSSVSEYAKCTFTPQLSRKVSPPENCISNLQYSTIALVPALDVTMKLDEYIESFNSGVLQRDRERFK